MKPSRVKAASRAYLTLLYLTLFYPAVIAVLIWLTVKDMHWGYGAALIAFVLIFDPLWRSIVRNFRRR